MKTAIKKINTGFNPVIIELKFETIEELRLMTFLIGNITQGEAESISKINNLDTNCLYLVHEVLVEAYDQSNSAL
jgi:hypothetical protein